MDVGGHMNRPDAERLALYCERVAVAPGRLVLAILGQQGEDAEAVAHALGQALQRTNILRDEKEDAAQQRRYFAPAERAAFAHATEAYFRQADSALRNMPRREVVPVYLMRDVYWRLFCRVRDSSTVASQSAMLPWLMMRSLRYRLVR